MQRRRVSSAAELPWLPRAVREGAAAHAEWVHEAGGAWLAAAPLLADLLAGRPTRDVVALGASEGAPWPALAAATTALLRDASGGPVRVRTVGGLHVPPEVPGVRAVLDFDRFAPGRARALLADAVGCAQPVLALQCEPRGAPAVLHALCAPALALASATRARPLRLNRLLWSWVVPAIPACALWDDLARPWRTYDAQALMELITGLGTGWAWSAGTLRGGWGTRITWLAGRPLRRR